MTESEQSELLEDLARGRETAFAALYDCRGAWMFRVARGLVGGATDAEEVVQETFVGLVRSRRSLASVRSLDAYLFTALRRAATRWIMRRQREPASLPEEIAAPARPAPDERSDRLVRARRSLPAEQREVLALKIDGGLTFAEIAGVIGISANTVASRYRYALEKLRDAMSRPGSESDQEADR